MRHTPVKYAKKKKKKKIYNSQYDCQHHLCFFLPPTVKINKFGDKLSSFRHDGDFARRSSKVLCRTIVYPYFFAPQLPSESLCWHARLHSDRRSNVFCVGVSAAHWLHVVNSQSHSKREAQNRYTPDGSHFAYACSAPRRQT